MAEVVNNGLSAESLLSRNEKLSGAVRRYRLEAEQSAKAAKDLEKANKDLASRLEALEANSDIKALTAQIRGLKHRQAFDQVALKAGADPAKLGDLWDLSKVQAESDEPDMEALGKLIGDQKKARSWAFQQATTQGDQPPPNPDTVPIPAPGSGQGGGQPKVTTYGPDHWADEKFVFRNFDKMAADAKERIARGEV